MWMVFRILRISLIGFALNTRTLSILVNMIKHIWTY